MSTRPRPATRPRLRLAWILLAAVASLPAPAAPAPTPPPGWAASAPGPAPNPAPAGPALDAPPRGGADSEPLPLRLTRRLREAGPVAPAMFVGLFVLTCVLCVPTAFLALSAGAVWGLGLGILYVWFGILLGSSAAFLIGRHGARAWVQRRLRRHPRLEAIEEAVSAEGWRIVVLARLAPGSPFFLLNYAFGLTRIGFWPHLLATAFSALPGAVLLVYLGSAGHLALAGRTRTVWDWILFGIGLAALAAGVTLVSRRARRALEEKLRRHSPEPPPATPLTSPDQPPR